MQEAPRRRLEFFVIIGHGEMLGGINFPGGHVVAESFAVSRHAHPLNCTLKRTLNGSFNLRCNSALMAPD